jgi:acyl-CoA synthetase (AMP-forming)/AMP-acid ligase II
MMTKFITDVVSVHAENVPLKQAVVAVDKGGGEESLTYLQLVFLAKELAATLVSSSPPHLPIFLCLNSGLEFVISFLACMFAGRISVPSAPPKGRLSKQRLAHICASVRPHLILTTVDHVQRLAALPAVESSGIGVRAVSFPRGCSEPLPTAPDMPPRCERAFIQFTSGSTAAPKPIIITHENVLSNHETISSIFGQTHASVVVSWLPPHHDMGLIGCILHPLLLGATTVLLRPSTFAQSPIAWLKTIMRHRATISGAPNFAFDYCTRNISDSDAAGLDLSSLEVLFNGSERVSAASMWRFEDKFRGAKLRGNVFCPCYGLAEATLMVTGTQIGRPFVVRHCANPPGATLESVARPQPGQSRNVGCGRVMNSNSLVIVDSNGNIQPEGKTGAIWVRGGSICEGQLLEDMQVRSLLDKYTMDGRGPFLQTGDEGFVVDSELFVTGRLKDVLVVRGIKISPEELELILSCADLLSTGCRAVAIADPDLADTDVILIVEVDRSRRRSLPEFEAAILTEIARETGISPRKIVFVRRGMLPRTTSGKINRSLCSALLQRESVHVRQTTPELPRAEDAIRSFATIEEQFLVNRIEELLGKKGVRGSDNPFAHGLSSIETNRLVSAINDRFHTDWTVGDLYTFATIEAAAEGLQKSSHIHEIHLLDPGGEPVAALPHQRAMWIQSQVDSGGLYNVSVIFRLGLARLDLVAATEELCGVINESLSKHRILRSSFNLAESAVRLKEDVSARISISSDSLAPSAVRQRLSEQQRQSFDLSRAPMIRGTALLLPRGTLYHLVFSQLIVDGYSIALLCREWRNSLNRQDQAVPLAHGDETTTGPQFDWYARWFNQKYLGGEKWQQDRNFWATELRHADLRLRLPVDVDSGSAPAAFEMEYVQLAPEATTALARLSRELAVTPSMIVLTHTIAFLRRITSEKAICLGVHTAGRVHPSTRQMIGPLLNTLCLVCDWADDPTFAEAVQRTAARMSTLLKHELFPFAEAARLSSEGTGRFSRLPSVYFNAIEMLRDPISADLLEGFVQPTILGSDVLLTIHMARAAETYALRFDFNGSSIRRATVRFWSACMLKQIQEASTHPKMRFSEFRFPRAPSDQVSSDGLPGPDLFRVPVL